MKILILGGTGAMGAPLVDVLKTNGHEIYVTSRKKHDNDKNICYIMGDAHELDFVNSLLIEKYDVIVDFMSYKENEFKERISLLLNSTDQYVFLSSCRVYAQSEEKINELSPRLLDTCQDLEYLATSEYALEKAREENILINNPKTNWTIIRPTVTYNENRLQLGNLEIQHWLFRALKQRTIVFSEELMNIVTPMTNGRDVAFALSLLLGNKKALGQIIQIASPESMCWKDILKIYVDEIEKYTGIKPKVYLQKNAHVMANVLDRKWQLIYNRLYNRVFDSSKVDEISGVKIFYTPIESGIRECIRKALTENNMNYNFSGKIEAYFDKITKEYTPISEIKSKKEIIKYIIARYTPYLKMKYGRNLN